MTNKELRLLMEIYKDKYRKVTPSKPMAQYIQRQIFEVTGELIPLHRIIKVKPFKKIIYKKIIIMKNGKPKTIKRLRLRGLPF